jgi:ketosteroid isomerase-like protein
MSTEATIIDLEKKFWQSIVDEDADTAIGMLTEPALMVSPMGSMQFDHQGYRKMAEHGSQVLKSYELSDLNVVFPNESTAVCTYRVKQSVAPRGEDSGTTEEMNDSSTWIRTLDGWKCVVHTETPAGGKRGN